MDILTFKTLPNTRFEFTTYTNKKYIGGAVIQYVDDKEQYFIVPHTKIREYNAGGKTIEEQISLGILIPINPDVIDDYQIVPK